MSTTLPTPDLLTSRPLPAGEHLSTNNYLNNKRGLWSWLSTLDHKRIALMYMVGILFSFFLGGIFAMLIRAELFSAGQTILPQLPKQMIDGQMTYYPWQDTYNQVFTLHGAIMVFLFIIPSIPAIFGNFALPVMLGAKDVAFPRLNLASFYLWCAGAVLFIGAIAVGGLDTGWTFYTPYSIKDTDAVFAGVLPATAGAFILGFSSILTGVNFIASIHMLRPKNMTWFRMPLMLWGLYATSIIQILATPVLAITLLLLFAERLADIGLFDPTKGGDPVLYQHFFWFYSHPAVYIMILPAMGVISEIISVFSRKHIFGYAFIAMSSLAIAMLGFLVWGHHMFVSGQSNVANAIFSFFTFFVAIPSAVKVFNWLATMWRGSIWLKSPMLYAMSFIWVFTIGGLTGLFLGSLATDVHLTDTYFVVAHFHYVMVGGTVFAFLAGLHYWWPKMFGKMCGEKGSVTAWLFIFFGFNLTFFPQFIMGSHGMPRRYADWSAPGLQQFAIYHQLSTIGAFTQLAGFLILAGVLIHSLVKGKLAPRNPWGANSLEWHTSSPPPMENFAHTPVAGDPYDFDSWHWNDEMQGFDLHEPAAGDKPVPEPVPAH